MVLLDVAIIVLYLILLVFIGVIVSKRVKTHEDSVVGGRGFGTFFAGVGKAANLAGGPSTVGTAGYGFTYGITGAWFTLSTAISCLVWVPLAPRLWRAVSRGRFTSVGGYLGYRFGGFARVFAGLLNCLAYMSFVAAQIIATGTILAVLLGWSHTMAMLITTVIVIAYTILGGLKAVVITDIVQMAIIYIGLVIIMPPVALGEVGGMNALFDALPEAFKQIGAMGWPRIVGTLMLPTILMPFTMQATYAYTAACKSSNVAWKSGILTAFLYIIPCMACLLVGMIVFVLFPDIAVASDALPTIVTALLPHGLIGILLAAVLSATMSTSSTCLICSANCLVTDVVGGLSKKERSGEEQLKVTRICMGLIGVLTLCITLFNSDIISIISIGYALGTGGLLAPALAAMFWKRATKPACIAAMVVGGGSYVFIQFSQIVTWPPLFLSLGLSLILIIAVSLFTKPSDPTVYDVYFEDEWAKSPKNPESKVSA
jgi:SSS family solute:Na+ symporter